MKDARRIQSAEAGFYGRDRRVSNSFGGSMQAELSLPACRLGAGALCPATLCCKR